MSPITKEMVDKADWEAMDRGEKPKKKSKPVHNNPEQPKVKNQIKASNIPLEELVSITGRKKTIQDKDGIRFIGFEVSVQLRDKKLITGWMTDGDILYLQRMTREVQGVDILMSY